MNTHQCPDFGQAITPCCGRPILELPRTDRLTDTPDKVTCSGKEQQPADHRPATNAHPETATHWLYIACAEETHSTPVPTALAERADFRAVLREANVGAWGFGATLTLYSCEPGHHDTAPYESVWQDDWEEPICPPCGGPCRQPVQVTK